MRTNEIPPVLRERLGHEATVGLLELVEAEQMAWSDRVLNIAIERFERRLAEQLAETRVTCRAPDPIVAVVVTVTRGATSPLRDVRAGCNLPGI